MPSPKKSPAKRAKKPSPKSKAAAPADDAPKPREAKIGDNNPPEPTPFETMEQAINDLYEEAEQWLDADPIANEGQAEQVTRLKGMLADAEKTADAERAAEKKPHWDAAKAVDTKWKPLIEKAKKAKAAAQRKLTPWLQAIEAEKQRIAAEKAEAARKAEEALRKAHEEKRDSGDLADADALEEAEKAAKEAKREANKAKRENSAISTDAGRVQLRTVYTLKVEDRKKLLLHYIATDPDWVAATMRERAESDMRKGARTIPGCVITSEKRAV